MDELTDKKTIKQLALDFILCCIFGQSDKLIDAAVNRAYIDMASHTMKQFKDDETKLKWTCRFNASNCITDAIKKLFYKHDF